MTTVAAIATGFIMDLLLGDPRGLPHPICLIGRLIDVLEKGLRRISGENPSNLLVGGAVLAVAVTGAAFIVPWFILRMAEAASPKLAFILEAFMFYQIFATKCLQAESMKVYDKLRTEGIEAARKQLSFIVGRDTADLNEEEVTKATVETVAENTTDGIVAPMLFMFLGGAPLTFLYKAVNTMDSMVGYRNEKYLYFGRCAARLDDLLNFLPARLAGVLMIAASYFLAYDYKGACRIFLRDRNNHLSPNSAQTEASCAGALNIELGGGHFYAGRFVPKQTIGEAVKKAELNDIKKANNLMLVTSVLSLALMALIRLSIIFLKDVFHV